MPFEDVLVHTARPQVVEEAGPPVDGERDTAPREGTPFDCALFLPPGREEANSQRRGRQVRRPTLLFSIEDRGGNAVVLSHKAAVFVTAPELTGPDPVEWLVDGSPQPFGPPGEVIGYQTFVTRVED